MIMERRRFTVSIFSVCSVPESNYISFGLQGYTKAWRSTLFILTIPDSIQVLIGACLKHLSLIQ